MRDTVLSATWQTAPAGDLPAPESGRTKAIIRGVAIGSITLTLVYLAWRAAFTIDLGVAWLAIPFFIMELHAVMSLCVFAFSLWDVDGVIPKPPRYNTDYRIAVLIPTYNESTNILLPTIAAAVALRPAHATWVLDDGDRAEVAELAAELGAGYVSRPDNSHAKAGNLNHALQTIDADLIAVLDADHVPTPQFLTHLIGYFDDPRIAVVQTPQEFYNTESFEHAANADESGHYHEQMLFYRMIQPGKNRWGAAFWCGTNAMIRVSALREAGGVATETITEDIHTTIRLQRRGWKTVYHNEVLARGLAAQTARDYQAQRFRWGTGAMQLLRRENPFFVGGLTLPQRLAYGATLLGWFDGWFSLGLLLVPIIVLFTGAVPIDANPLVFLPVFGVVFASQQLALRLLSRKTHRAFLPLIFELTRMTANMRATLTLLFPRKVSFDVTPKGRQGDGRGLGTAPGVLVALLVVSALAATWFCLVLILPGLSYPELWVAIFAAFWLTANMVLMWAAVRRAQAPQFGGERRNSVRFSTSLPAQVDDAFGEATNVSLTGAQVRFQTPMAVHYLERSLRLWFGEAMISLGVYLVSLERTAGGSFIAGMEFLPGQDGQRARLALALFNAQTVDGTDEAEPAQREHAVARA